MKRFILAVLILLVSSIGFAADWTVETTRLESVFEWGNGQRMYVINYTGKSSGAASGTKTLSTELYNTFVDTDSLPPHEAQKQADRIMEQIEGGVLYYIKYDPYDGPTTEATLTFYDETSAPIIATLTLTDAEVPEGWPGDVDDEGILPPFTELKWVIGDWLSGKTATVYLWILK